MPVTTAELKLVRRTDVRLHIGPTARPRLDTHWRQAIARENDTMLRDYFAADYVLHLPRVDIDFEALRGYFASLRAAFTDLRLAREQIVVEGLHVAARTRFSGTFTGVFAQSPVGPMEPHGKPVAWEIMNMFR